MELEHYSIQPTKCVNHLTILVRDSSDERHRIITETDLAVFGPVPKLRGEVDSAGTAEPHAPME